MGKEFPPMMMTPGGFFLNIREKLARIDEELADHDRQEIRCVSPWVPVVAGMTAGAALFASGMAFMKLLGG